MAENRPREREGWQSTGDYRYQEREGSYYILKCVEDKMC